MKYKAQQTSDGQWAVFTGARYFVDTVTENQREAERIAFTMSMRWHQEQIDSIFDKGVDIGHFKWDADKSDFLC